MYGTIALEFACAFFPPEHFSDSSKNGLQIAKK